MSERAAFLRAIADQPADRTARLVFADFLEEAGDPADAARAGFVRAQVEADTVHPNSNRRAELETRARELFAGHWLDWWAGACDAVGLPPPYRPLRGVRGWLTRRVGRPPVPGFPYGRSRDAPGVTVEDRGHGPPLDVLKGVRFSGGFPEALSFFGQTGFAARFLRKWADTSPLAALDLHGIVARDWRAIDGPHLSGLRALGLGQSAGPGLTAVASSAHLSRLEALHLVPDRSNVRWATEQYRAFADSPLAGRVTRLSIVLADVGEALAFHGAPLDNLTALEIRTPRTLSEREEFDRAAAAAVDLLSRPDLDRVEELTLDPVTAQALADVDRTVLGRLRKLVLEGDSSERRPFPLTTGVLPPGLADLSLTVADGSLRGFAMLTKSPVVGRLRHLRLDGALRPTADAVAAMVGLSRALDVGRLETLRLGPAVCPSPAVRSALAGKFGARVRFG